MRIELDEPEIERAIVKYLRGKNTSDSPNHEYMARIVWRGKYAIVDIRPAVPVLNDAVQEDTASVVAGVFRGRLK